MYVFLRVAVLRATFGGILHTWHASAFKFGGTSAMIAADSRRQYLIPRWKRADPNRQNPNQAHKQRSEPNSHEGYQKPLDPVHD